MLLLIFLLNTECTPWNNLTALLNTALLRLAYFTEKSGLVCFTYGNYMLHIETTELDPSTDRNNPGLQALKMWVGWTTENI